MALEIDTMQKSRKTLEAEHEARLTTEKQQQTRLKFEWGVKLSKYEKKAILDAEHLATTVASFGSNPHPKTIPTPIPNPNPNPSHNPNQVASFGGLVQSVNDLERDANELALTNQKLTAELRECRLSADASGDVSERLQQASDATQLFVQPAMSPCTPLHPRAPPCTPLHPLAPPYIRSHILTHPCTP